MFTGRRRKRLSNLSSIDPHPGVLRSSIKYEAVTTDLTYDLNAIQRKQHNIKHKILRSEESGDITRLRGIHDELGWIRANLEK